MKCSKSTRKQQLNGSTTSEQVLAGLDLTGKTIAITGTTNGVGIGTARFLALAGAHVICLNRNKELTEEAIEKIRSKKNTVKISFIQCDLSSIASVRPAAGELLRNHQKLDVLILNGGDFHPAQKATTDGLEVAFGVHHVGHFHLTTLLLPLLVQSSPARIIIVCSDSHACYGISPSSSLDEKITELINGVQENVVNKHGRFYSLSKRCNLLVAMKLHRDLQGKQVDVHVVHPDSFIGENNLMGSSTGILSRIVNWYFSPSTKTLSKRASTTIYCAVHPDSKGVSGKYWDSCFDEEKILERALNEDVELQDDLWKRTEEIIEEIEKKH